MKFVLGALVSVIAAGTAAAQEGVTVQALLTEGYEIKGVMPSNAGPALLLQKGDQLIMCFVAETSDSAEISTQYCKPVK